MLEKWRWRMADDLGGRLAAGPRHPVQGGQGHGRGALVDGVGEVPRGHRPGLAQERLQLLLVDRGALAVGGGQGLEDRRTAARGRRPGARRACWPPGRSSRTGPSRTCSPSHRLRSRPGARRWCRPPGRRPRPPSPGSGARCPRRHQHEGRWPGPGRPGRRRCGRRRPRSSRPASRTTTTRRSTRKGGVVQASIDGPDVELVDRRARRAPRPPGPGRGRPPARR